MPSGLWNAAVGKEGSFPGHLTRSFPGTSAGGDGRAGEQVAAAPHPRDKWQRAFQISGSTALWGMCHVCQKTIKKPLAGNAFAKPAPDTATGCTFTCESGMQQPWSGFPHWAPWPCSSPFSSLILFLFYVILNIKCSRKPNATFLHGFHIRASCSHPCCFFYHEVVAG